MVDYDEIRSGRRREWWKRREAAREEASGKLVPLDEMARLIDEADKESAPRKQRKHSPDSETEGPLEDFGLPGPPPDPSLLEAEDRAREKPKEKPTHRSRFDRERAKDRVEWLKTRRQLVVLGLMAAVALLALGVVGAIWQVAAGGREKAEIDRYMAMAESGQFLDDISSPIRALATYRSAWIRGDMRLVWKMSTLAVKRDVLSVRSEQQHINDQLLRYHSGGYKEWIDLMKRYSKPEYLRKPSGPYRNGVLAVFLTEPSAPPRNTTRKPERYALAFVYVEGQWQFFEGIPVSLWKTSWDTIYDAKPGATVEDTWL